ncbi:uncharacterized protein LOC110979561 [Acanthaster planci]|uniref:Uncharacterized protein LOC110979561 n=1 Tax=Acanthaster planci TaxID=133434 RepID=A0A8B7YHQ5_ACAPL|nr:uncharacterized protein LOC110979561 [Acanthaster planci]
MQVMAESRPGVGRVFARWNPAAFVTLYLGLLCMDSANSQCPAGMCERPPSTTSTQPTKDSMCYKCGDSLLINCNPGFRQNGDNYIAKCENEVWTPDNGCQIDLFTILVASSASLVAILIFALFVLCIVEYRFSPKKRKHHEVSKANGEKKRRAHQNTGCEVANGQKIGKKPVNDSEDFEDDFTDDEETYHNTTVYENQQF